MIGHTLAIDSYGYIYIHGVSNSPVFGGQGPGVVDVWTWVYAKTHWELTYEV